LLLLLFSSSSSRRRRRSRRSRRRRDKGKVIPLQVWTGPEGCRRLRLPDFKTFGT